MGIDVSLSRGLDVVILDELGNLQRGPLKLKTAELRAVIRESHPDVIAIDSPPAWATSGASRPIERQLAKLGVAIFATPSDPRGRPFFAWMEEGFRVFAAAAAEGYSLYRGERSRGPYAIELFPHASAVVLRGSLRGAERKIDFRREALHCAGVDTASLTTQDHVDAALAAATGIRFLQSVHGEVGVAGEAVLVVPARIKRF